MKRDKSNARAVEEPRREPGPVRILYCIDSMAPGGTEKQLAALIQGLDRTRFEPLICTLKPSKIALAELKCQALELSLESFAAPSLFRCLRNLRRFIREQKVDIVQTFFRDSTLVGLCATLGTPVRARIASFRDLGFWHSPREAWPLRLAYRHFDGFTANARAVAARAHTVDGIPLGKIEVIYNGVRIPLPSASLIGDPPVVGIVANLNRPVKRVDLFLEAANLIRREVPSARFVIVGDGPLRAALSSQAERLNLSVRFVGEVPDAAIHVSSFDVGVVSSDSEGLSNSILEYMAAQVPTVARRVGGNSEVVTDGVTGLLVDGDRAADLARAVVRLLQDPTTRRRMGRAAREAAIARYSMESYVRNYQEYYGRLIRIPLQGAVAAHREEAPLAISGHRSADRA